MKAVTTWMRGRFQRCQWSFSGGRPAGIKALLLPRPEGPGVPYPEDYRRPVLLGLRRRLWPSSGGGRYADGRSARNAVPEGLLSHPRTAAPSAALCGWGYPLCTCHRTHAGTSVTRHPRRQRGGPVGMPNPRGATPAAETLLQRILSAGRLAARCLSVSRWDAAAERQSARTG